MKLDRPKYKDIEAEAFSSVPEKMDIVQLKYDGWWGQLVLEGKEWKLYSRTGQLKKRGGLSRDWPHHTVVHGEFCYGTQWSKQRDEFYERLFAFDVTEVEGDQGVGLHPWADRQDILQVVLQMLNTESIVRGVVLAKSFERDRSSYLWKNHVCAGNEFEGLVFKDSEAPWGQGFARMKKLVECDYVCMGFEQSESDRHTGWGVASVLGGLVVGGQLKQVCKVSGLADDQRKAFYDRPADFVGKVFTANGKMLMKSGALRHPNFVMWRPDKRAEECVLGATGGEDAE